MLFAKRTFHLKTENAFNLSSHISHVESHYGRVLKLNLGEPDFPVPSHIKNEIKHQLDINNTRYCDPQGLISLRKSIANHASESRQIDVLPDQVVVFPGAKTPIGLAQQVYCNPGDEVIYPSPGFPIYESFIRYVNAIPVPLHLNEDDGFSFSCKALEGLISSKTKLIFLNFPSNPTGCIASIDQLKMIADVIQDRCSNDVRIYSDEIYENIIFDEQTHFSIASIPGMARRTIIVSGFSKSYAWTGGRIGYAIFPTKEEAAIFKNLNINYFSCVSPYNQEAARFALESYDSTTSIKHMVDTFERRRDETWSRINQIPGLSCHKPEGAFYLFPNISRLCSNLGLIDFYSNLPEDKKEQSSPATLFQMFALYEHQVAVLDRRSFGSIGSENKHYIRVSIASSSDALNHGLNKLQDASQDFVGLDRFLSQRPDLPK